MPVDAADEGDGGLMEGDRGGMTSPESKSTSQMSPGSLFNCFWRTNSSVTPIINGVGAKSNWNIIQVVSSSKVARFPSNLNFKLIELTTISVGFCDQPAKKWLFLFSDIKHWIFCPNPKSSYPDLNIFVWEKIWRKKFSPMGPPWSPLGPYLGSKSWNFFITHWAWYSRVWRSLPWQFQPW